jgi:hypothetical protein
MSKINLKMCPLCCDPIRTNMEVYLEEKTDGNNKYKAGCGSCGCSTPEFDSQIEAANFWNNRCENPENKNCPICNNVPEFLEYKVSEKQVEPFFRYKCNQCGFASGISKNKDLIVNSWIKR